MDKYEYIVNLAEKTAKRVSQNRESWMKFLTSAARIYKYPFKEQLLIYAQNPDATACASIEIWNKRMNCWVNKGSSGIALPDDTATYGHKLKYVFDVSDPVLTSRCFACHATSVCLSFGVMRYPSFSFPAYGNNLGSFRYILFSQEIPVSLLPVYWKHRIKFRHHSNPAIHHIRQLLVLYGT